MRPTFEAKFPEIVGISDATWAEANALYPLFFKVNWNATDEDDQRILYLVAHLLILIKNRGKAGNTLGLGRIMSTSVDTLSVSYAVTPLNVDEQRLFGDFSSTTYGNIYLSLVSNSFRRGGFFV